MASERQIVANRRNAKKSSGPRSDQGKQRASNNAFRHGLFSKRTRAAVSKETENFARRIVDQTFGAIALEQARIAAESENELTLIKVAKCAVIDRTDIFGDFKPPHVFSTDPSKEPAMMTLTEKRRYQRAKDLVTPEQQEEAARSAAAEIVLAELTRLLLFEKRAAARRDRAIRRLMKIKKDQNSRSKADV